VVDEARQGGAEHLIFVTGRNKGVIEDHFDRPFELEHTLRERNKLEAPGLDAIGGAYLLMDKPAHPNAAKILVNWLLSRDGQTALQRDGENAGSTDSLRIDIPKADVNPLMRRKDGVKYLEMWNPNWMNMKPVEELINQAVGEGRKS
jgi:hypothetical protein